LLVKLKPGFVSHLHARGHGVSLGGAGAALGLSPAATLKEPAINRLLNRQAPGDSSTNQPNFDRFLYLQLPPGADRGKVLSNLRRHPWVDYAEEDGVGSGGFIPNDPDFRSQWHHRNVSQPAAAIQTTFAWDVTSGTSNVIVAVLDSGLNTALAEFAGRVLPGFNFASNNAAVDDDHGHGTAVAGTLAAAGNNQALVAGVDWHCRLLPVKVLGYDNTGQYSWWAQGIDFAVSRGAKVINLSAGGFGTSTTLTRAITNAIARGTIFVTISHNDGSGTVRYPGNLPECITIGATDSHDRRCGFSNFGPQVDLVAPGTNIVTVGSNGSAQSWWGTSFAAPLVSGVCALMAAVRPDLDPQQARNLLVAGADDLVGDAEDQPGYDPYYGWGRLNARNSLILAQTRIRSLVPTNGTDLHLSWACPTNAATKNLYQIERASSADGPWSLASKPDQFVFNGNECGWIDPRAATNRTQSFYRIRLRNF
jgi:subtilisin family serine protease